MSSKKPPKTARDPTALPKSQMTPSSINAYAVSQLSARRSGPPPRIDDGRLPDKYKSAARRITMAIVALPIAIVTSYVLYQRVVMGEERKRLVPRPEDRKPTTAP
ncbi:MAG: hypothetical protein M1827_001970 [Pycnora praestabilis]|nr:MAG: hypothetical protein M1827_001970 [Pycnora praestabilis]